MNQYEIQESCGCCHFIKETLDTFEASERPRNITIQRCLLLLLHPIDKYIDLLVIEASHPSDQRRFSSWILVPPQNIFILLTIHSDVVVVRQPFVRTSGGRTTICDILPLELLVVNLCSAFHISLRAYSSLRHIISWSQHRLKEEHVIAASRNRHTIDFDSNVPRRRKYFYAFARGFQLPDAVSMG